MKTIAVPNTYYNIKYSILKITLKNYSTRSQTPFSSLAF